MYSIHLSFLEENRHFSIHFYYFVKRSISVFFQCAYYIRIRSQWKYYENCIFFHTSMHTYVYFYAFYLTEFVCICLIFIFHADGFVAAADATATTIVDVIVSNLLEIF